MMARVACIVDAQPIEKYSPIMENCDFLDNHIDVHDVEFAELIDEIRGKLLVAELMVRMKKLDHSGWIDFNEADQLWFDLITGKKAED